METSTALFIICLLLLVVFAFWLMRWRFRRATRQVIDAFIQNGAVGPEKAKTLEELGLVRKGGVTLLRDYRHLALQGLMSARAIDQVDGKFYLTKEAYERQLTERGQLPF